MSLSLIPEPHCTLDSSSFYTVFQMLKLSSRCFFINDLLFYHCFKTSNSNSQVLATYVHWGKSIVIKIFIIRKTFLLLLTSWLGWNWEQEQYIKYVLRILAICYRFYDKNQRCGCSKNFYEYYLLECKLAQEILKKEKSVIFLPVIYISIPSKFILSIILQIFQKKSPESNKLWLFTEPQKIKRNCKSDHIFRYK